MLKIKNIIITGGSGLVGSAFKKIKNNYQNTNLIFLNSKQADLTDFKFTDIDTGLTNTIEWFKNNYPNKTRI